METETTTWLEFSNGGKAIVEQISFLYSFFHKTSKKDDIPLTLPRLQINNYNTERIPSIKFLGVLSDENLSLKDHNKYTKNKISKNIEYYIRQEII